MSLTPIGQAMMITSGITISAVCMHFPMVKAMLRSILSLYAVFNVVGSLLSKGRITRPTKVGDRPAWSSKPLMLSVANWVLKAMRVVKTIIAPMEVHVESRGAGVSSSGMDASMIAAAAAPIFDAGFLFTFSTQRFGIFFSIRAVKTSRCVLNWKISQRAYADNRIIAVPLDSRNSFTAEVVERSDDVVGIIRLKNESRSNEPSS